MRRVRNYASPLVLLAAVAALLAMQLRHDAKPAPGPRPWPVTETSRVTRLLGLTTTGLAKNSYRPWDDSDLAEVAQFERRARAHANVVMWYADWQHVKSPDLDQLRAVAARGSVPEITWEPWDSTKALRVPQPAYRLAAIIRGLDDDYIRRWARALAGYGKPVRLRFAQEMNGNWYPWAEASNGNSRGEFVLAWKHVWQIFHQEHATNVKWVWSPVANGVRGTQYPGDAYVDILGLSGFNGGYQLRYSHWRPFSKVFGTSLHRLHVISPRKPIELSEVACAENGGSKAQWIRGMFKTVEATPQIDTILWFNVDKLSDWRIDSSVRSAVAFRSSLAASPFAKAATATR